MHRITAVLFLLATLIFSTVAFAMEEKASDVECNFDFRETSNNLPIRQDEEAIDYFSRLILTMQENQPKQSCTDVLTYVFLELKLHQLEKIDKGALEAIDLSSRESRQADWELIQMTEPEPISLK